MKKMPVLFEIVVTHISNGKMTYATAIDELDRLHKQMCDSIIKISRMGCSRELVQKMEVMMVEASETLTNIKKLAKVMER